MRVWYIKIDKSQEERKQITKHDVEYHPTPVKLNTWKDTQKNMHGGYGGMTEL
jgi:hypothetical protein